MYNYPIDKLPAKGYMLAYFAEQPVFAPYEIRDGAICFAGCEILDQEMPRECHFFDRNTEYRLVKREFRNDVIETVFTEKEEEIMDPDLLYVEEVLVRKEYKGIEKLRIVNRYAYSDNDTLILKNYRIAMV